MKSIFILVLLCSVTTAKAQTITDSIMKKSFTTSYIGKEDITLDGEFNEASWNLVDWASGFTVNRPNEGEKPSQETQFKIIYDEKYLYVAFHCFESSPDSIENRMGRRDDFPGDWVEINIDSYHDLRSGFSFSISSSGVRGDEFISDNGNNWDSSWNPIWFAKTKVNHDHWTAEIKIPFSQLRFGYEENKVWGIQVTRRIFRKEERSIWQFIPQKSGVWVSAFGELHGIKNIQPRKQMEIAPYVVAKVDKYPSEKNNPYATGTDGKITFGLDGKLALTSNIILDFTVNPDFGQVEADPSQVRIDGYQNFFQERRPFFIESRNIFNYQLTGSAVGLDLDNDILFYSRRIGSNPHGYVNTQPGEFASIPSATPILAAAKVSGKTSKGFSIGILESLTKNVYAEIDKNGERTKSLIEPLTNFSVLRIQQDIKGGETVLGGMLTAVNRDNDLNELLHKNAYSGAFDFFHTWKNRKYYIAGNGMFSHVNGTKNKITQTQMSFEHLFQRSNANEFEVDTSLTSLTGHAATLKFGKGGGKEGKYGQIIRYQTGITYRSPEFEINDIGFLYTANEINHYTWVGLQFQRQVGIFRSARVNYNHNFKWDFSGQNLLRWFNTNLHGTFLNNWSIGTGFNYEPLIISNNALRGGSSLRIPDQFGHWFYIESDGRKKLSLFLNGWWGVSEENTGNYYGTEFTARYQPSNALSLSANVNYNYVFREQGQYVTDLPTDGGRKYIVGQLNQNTLSFTFRLNYNVTPDLTIQYYGQPFLTRPLFSKFGYVSDALNQNFNARFYTYTPDQIALEDNRYAIDENIDNVTDYYFNKPDFNFIQFRSNLVLRWEYKAGSELYLVWAHNNNPDAFADLNSHINRSLWSNVLNEGGRNTFLIKATYRWLR